MRIAVYSIFLVPVKRYDAQADAFDLEVLHSAEPPAASRAAGASSA
jgi:hypothetical protein